MGINSRRLLLQAAVWCCSLFSSVVHTSTIVEVEPGKDTLALAISGAVPGDILYLKKGIYQGQVIIDRSLTLHGNIDSVVDGGGEGTVITIDAPDVTLKNITIQNSGIDLSIEDSGVFVTKNGDRALIESNRFRQNLIGVYLKGPDDAVVRANTITGNNDLRMNERGNGIHLWNTPGSLVEANKVRFGRDGIFVTTSRNNIFRNNEFSDLRFAIHYMYTNLSEVSGNISRGNHVAYALMYSSYLKVHDNRSTGDRDRGLFFNYANYSEVSNNMIEAGPEKCVFIYNSNFNQIRQNVFKECQLGIHFTAGSEQNTITENAFINNRTQVKYVGTRYLEWSAEGRGNYWSDHTAFDLDGNGLSDQAYRPNNLVDQIIWRYPLAKVLLNSPAFDILRWAQSQFPALHPGGVVDSAPLMTAPDAITAIN